MFDSLFDMIGVNPWTAYSLIIPFLYLHVLERATHVPIGKNGPFVGFVMAALLLCAVMITMVGKLRDYVPHDVGGIEGLSSLIILFCGAALLPLTIPAWQVTKRIIILRRAEAEAAKTLGWAEAIMQGEPKV